MTDKKIILMRHAHAMGAFEAGVPRDFLRPLSSLGIAQAQDDAAQLKELLNKADKIICSPRLRAVETADIVAAVFGLQPVAVENLGNGDLTGAGLEDIIFKELQNINTLIVIGHNPSISEAAARLGAPAVLGTAEFVVINK